MKPTSLPLLWLHLRCCFCTDWLCQQLALQPSPLGASVALLLLLLLQQAQCSSLSSV
jgi:hypothetical protein